MVSSFLDTVMHIMHIAHGKGHVDVSQFPYAAPASQMDTVRHTGAASVTCVTGGRDSPELGASEVTRSYPGGCEFKVLFCSRLSCSKSWSRDSVWSVFDVLFVQDQWFGSHAFFARISVF